MRHTKFAAIPLTVLALAACGGHSPRSDGPTTHRPAVHASPATQPLKDWYREAAVPLTMLGETYTDLGDSKSSTIADLQQTGDAELLRTAAHQGLAVVAPAGHPELDRSYDRVMNDALRVAGDIDHGHIAGFVTDADTAQVHLSALGKDISALTGSADPA